MSVSHTLAALGRLFRRTPLPPDDILEAYAHEVVPVLDRAEWLYQYWLEQSTLFSDSEKLGNVAAIHRWETASMGRSLERVRPPAVLAGAHESVLDALDMASRAAQLLSSGSRFHNASAVCEGQALLATSRDRRLTALRAMRRYLAAVMDAEPVAEQAADAGAGKVVAQAASLLAAQAAGQTQTQTQPEADPVVTATAGVVESSADQPLADADADALDAYDEYAHGYGYDHEEAHDDEEEDALPWLTRLAEQPTEPESSTPGAAGPPSAVVSPPVAPPASPQTPVAPPATPEPPPVPGWGSLFHRPPEPPGRSGSEGGAPTGP